jgi:hypothetical protein
MWSWQRHIEPRCRPAEPGGERIDLLALAFGNLRRFPSRFRKPLTVLVAE